MNETPALSRGGPRSITQWLFNPFRFVAGYAALIAGLGIILLSAIIGWLGRTHFDGVLDVHTGPEAPLWLFMAEGLVDWICMAVPLYLFALVFSRSAVRIADVFGPQALARWPYLITALALLPDANRRVLEQLMSMAGPTSQPPAINGFDLVIFVAAMAVTVLMVVWMVALMYKAYTLSCNLKAAKAIVSFIISLVGAEILSKAIIHGLSTSSVR
jgi:hypothetical protein